MTGQIADEYASRYLHNLPLDAPSAVPADLPSLAESFLRSSHYISWYEAGLLLYDISDPTAPIFLARKDTFPPSEPTGLEGNWGVYAWQDRILASDTDLGLFVLSNKKTHTVTVNPRTTMPPVYANNNFGLVLEGACD